MVIKPRTRQPRNGLAAYLHKELGSLEDRGAIQRAATKIAKAVAETRVEPRRAGLILYALHVASGNAKKAGWIVSNEAVTELNP